MPTMTDADLNSRLNELQTAFKSRMDEGDAIVATAKVENGVLLIDNARREAFQKSLAEAKDIKAAITELEEVKNLREWGNRPAGSSLAVAAGAAAHAFGNELKSLGEMFTESDEFKSFRQGGGFTMNAPWEIKGVDMGSKVQVKDVYTALPTGDIPAGFKPVQREPMVQRSMRRARVRDLFNVRQTSSALIEYFRVTGFTGLSNASPVPERTAGAFTSKPQTTLTFVGDQAPVRTIAHWEAAHRNVLDDVPQLRGVIDTELLYGLRLREDQQILTGAGTSEDLKGILNQGIQTYSAAGGSDTKADDIRRAATKAILAYYEPTGVVVHPSDWEDIELLKDSQGAYLLAVAVAMGAEQRLWRLPVVDTPAMTEGTALVGAFGLGATLYDRMEGNIRIAEQHSDFFIRNAVVILAEERLALTCQRPESFVEVSFA